MRSGCGSFPAFASFCQPTCPAIVLVHPRARLQPSSPPASGRVIGACPTFCLHQNQRSVLDSSSADGSSVGDPRLQRVRRRLRHPRPSLFYSYRRGRSTIRPRATASEVVPLPSHVPRPARPFSCPSYAQFPVSDQIGHPLQRSSKIGDDVRKIE
jgi:hypothetical protein